ncbi:MAG: acyltransferase family protein [Chthoniobacteraceae bacterium]
MPTSLLKLYQKPIRFHGLDAARASAMLIGVFFHSAMAYKTRGGWLLAEHSRSVVFDFFCSIIHGFRMPLFFLIAGFFSQMTFHRYGTILFLKKRLVRIGLPYLIGCYTLVPLCNLLATHIENGIWRSPFVGWTWRDAMGLGNVFHLWFLRDLLIFYVGAIMLSAVGRIFTPRIQMLPSRWFARLIQTWWGPVVLGMPVLLLFAINGLLSQTVFESKISVDFWTDASFFIGGWLLHQQPNLIDKLIERSNANFVATVFMTISGWAFAFGIENGSGIEVLLAVSKIYYAWYSTLFLIGIFSRYCNFHSSRVRYHVDASYWVYLVHLPIVFAMQNILVGFEFSAGVKFLMVSVVTMGACFLSYRLFVCDTFVGTVLIGKSSQTKTMFAPLQNIEN